MSVIEGQPAPGARRAIRRGVELPCELVHPQHDDPLPYVIADLSPLGLWIATSEPVRTGEQVVVCFRPDGTWQGGELMVFAEVARVSTSRRREPHPAIGMGLELIDLQRGQAHQLARWLEGRRAPVPRRRRPMPQGAPLLVAPAGERDADNTLRRGCWRGPIAYRALGTCWR